MPGVRQHGCSVLRRHDPASGILRTRADSGPHVRRDSARACRSSWSSRRYGPAALERYGHPVAGWCRGMYAISLELRDVPCRMLFARSSFGTLVFETMKIRTCIWILIGFGLSSALAAQTTAPSHPALRTELLELQRVDQEVRASGSIAASEMGDVDAGNTARLKAIIAEYGWPTRSMVGEDGASAAWLLAQHADRDPEFQRSVLRVMENSVVTTGRHDGSGRPRGATSILLVARMKKRYDFRNPRRTRLEPTPAKQRAAQTYRWAVRRSGSEG